MIRIRIGTAEDIDRVNAFYATHGHSASVSASERLVLAEEGATLIGVVRLCSEQGHLVLRTMRVSDAYQRQGIGTRMLRVLETLLQGQDCYCLPFEHLTVFYRQIGFVPIPVEQAPLHLQERYHRYCAKGHRMLVMWRPSAR